MSSEAMQMTEQEPLYSIDEELTDLEVQERPDGPHLYTARIKARHHLKTAITWPEGESFSHLIEMRHVVQRSVQSGLVECHERAAEELQIAFEGSTIRGPAKQDHGDASR